MIKAFAQELPTRVVPPCPSGGCGATEFQQLIQNIFNLGFFIVVPIATVVIAYGGFLLLTAGGNENKIKTGWKAIISAVVGVAVVWGSLIIYNAIIGAITGD